MDLNNEWDMFLANTSSIYEKEVYECGPTPKSSTLYISTKTIISFLNQPIDLKKTFWDIQVTSYNSPTVGVIKKQMKFNSETPEEVDMIEKEVSKCDYGYSMIIHHSDKVKYKDVRKVTVGVSKKDIISYRVRQKGAFYNCFVLIIRVKLAEFKEFHVKIFNTGKIEIPGIQTTEQLESVIEVLIGILRHYYPDITYNQNCEETVLINSNFNCGYFINRTQLYQILKYKYNISSVYDPCSYPGIQCKIYYKDGVITTVEDIGVSFMIFRTGSILIVGKCSKDVIQSIYTYLTDILFKEYENVVDHNCVHSKKDTVQKKIKRYILIKETI
jgi:TATA-box binding protein (TBP) (component of TFIID and TFIIIB)